MDWFRLKHTVRLCLTLTAVKRAEYIKKHELFYHMGEGCMTMFRKLPLYPKLISFGNNVWIASNVTFVTHDVIHKMINQKNQNCNILEYVGCIEIRDNCFIGSNTTILSNVIIDSDTIVGAGSLVSKSLLGGGVYAGVPAKYICSIADFLKKREKYDIDIQFEDGSLTYKTIEACWSKLKKGDKK